VNPAIGVKPPDRRAGRSKTYPYPSEALAVFRCAAIEIEWRELHVVAAYTYLRPGELHVLA
jgi:hypothetical protein